MYSEVPGAIPEGRCSDQSYRLAVYEAGHALSARALGLKIVSLHMLPRPPMLISDKSYSSFDWGSFAEMLEVRIIELFGGQLAEEIACSCNTCGSGDVARIDELTRVVAGLDGDEDAETIFFKLEDVATDIFSRQEYRDAIVPLAEFMYRRVVDGREVIDGKDLEAELDKHVPFTPKEKWSKRLFSFSK